jgi:hypothetical protein
MTATERHFAYRIDRWDADSNSVMEHVADIDEWTVAMAIYEAASKQWPGARITLRQGARFVEDSREDRVT